MTRFPLFEPETDQMGRYCQLLTHLLMSKTLSDDMERVAGDLLQDLVGYFADTLKAPRWLKTEDGMMVLKSRVALALTRPTMRMCARFQAR